MKGSAMCWLGYGLAVGLIVAITSAPALAGAKGGPKKFSGMLGGKDKVDSIDVIFIGGETATVTVNVEGKNADVDLRVLDSRGETVARDQRADDDCSVSFVPKQTGKYTIKIVNFRERVRSRYKGTTN